MLSSTSAALPIVESSEFVSHGYLESTGKSTDLEYAVSRVSRIHFSWAQHRTLLSSTFPLPRDILWQSMMP